MTDGDGEFCDNCGDPTTPLEGDSLTNTCETCGWPVDMSTDDSGPADPYCF